ncbi:MAG: hypothetical protein ACK2UB_01625 [Anaerolineales bacterium]
MKKFLEWIWLAVGLLLGAALGVGYAWVIRPAEFRGAEPAFLQPVYRGEYILLAATAYQATGDLERARDRLALFPELNPEVLNSLAQQVAAAHGSDEAARGLAQLSVLLLEETPTQQIPTATRYLSPTVWRTPTDPPTLALTVPFLPTATVQPAATSSPTLQPDFLLVSRDEVCDARISQPQIQVVVRTPDGAGVPGITIRIQWEGGGSRFVTGMKPDIDEGYADYEIEPGKQYQITLGDGLTVVRDLMAPTCPGSTAVAGGGESVSFEGSWRLEFEMR